MKAASLARMPYAWDLPTWMRVVDEVFAVDGPVGWLSAEVVRAVF
jgi:hypothetical protein